MISKNNKIELRDLGETKIIDLIDELIYKRTNKHLIRDDAFFYELSNYEIDKTLNNLVLALNTDMLVSTTDVPKQMNNFQIGFKSVLMNLSDILVKGVKPKSIFISLGLPFDLKIKEFESLVKGIIECCIEYEINYIGGDVNQTKEIIINPTIFGIQEKNRILYRKGMKQGDILVANGKFGLTGVGFDILLKKRKNLGSFNAYQKSINSILNPELSFEGLILSKYGLATASIDSSDGLAKSLRELMVSNPGLGFEIMMHDNLMENEAKKYSEEFDIPLENLIFNGGEEFIHLFTINPKNYKRAKKLIQESKGTILKIGTVINDSKIYFLNKGKKYKLKIKGYEHFTQSS
jgi:thiamine-monophosphate kinase